jgi:signal transduction histidine kinase
MELEKDFTDVVLHARKACHDLNQPLTVIMARSELLMLKLSPDDPHYPSVAQIHEQAEKMSALIEDLRKLFKSYQEE